MKLSICMMVKNEEKNLPRCLEKLSPLIESGLAELIIIDTGSEDKSIEIAKQYTNKVYLHEWNKNFSEMRNLSISYAKGDWIFIIDADERLDDVEKLIALMSSKKIEKYNTVIVQVKNLYDPNEENKYNLITSPRLFKNDGQFRYEGAVHNQPLFKGPNLSIDINLTHFGYIITDKKLMERKYKRTTELLKWELEKDPKNLYYIYQLGVSYDMHGDHKIALDKFREAYRLLKNRSIEEKKTYVYIYASYARIAYTNNQFKETLKVAREALSLNKDYIDLYYLIGISETQLENNQEAYIYLIKYLDLVNKYNELEISKDMSIIMYHIDDKSKSTVHYLITKYYLGIEKYNDAYKFYVNITSINEKIFSSVNLLIPLKKYSELRTVYDDFTLVKYKNSFLCTLEEKANELEESEKTKLFHEFSQNEDVYGLFNKTRIATNTDEKISLTKLFFKEVDLNKVPLFYSQIFKNLKENFKLMIDVFKKIEQLNLRGIVNYLVKEHDFKDDFENFILMDNNSIQDIEDAKVFISIANVLVLLHSEENNKISEKYLNIFKAYLNMGNFFVQELYRVDKAKTIYKNINNPEDRFFTVIHIVNNLIKEGNKKAAVKYMIEAVNIYEPMAKYIDLYKNEIFNLHDEKNLQAKNREFEEYKLKVKENINNLIDSGQLEESKELINKYEEIVREDVEIYSMKAIISIIEDKFKEAETVLKKGLTLHENNFDLIFNLAYVYEQTQKFNKALEQYQRAYANCNDENLKTEIKSTIQKISSEHGIAVPKSKRKIAFFVKNGMDSFLDDIIHELYDEYETKKIIVTDYKQIDEGMNWTDICWFEWCDELIAYGSQLPVARLKKVICRLHSYEAFTNYPNNVSWGSVDNVIFIAEHIRDFVTENFKLDKSKTIIIPNGIDCQRYSLKERNPGFNIAYVGYINYKKGPMLLLHTFKAIYDRDSRYKLYIAGKFQDARDELYFKQMTKEFGIEKSIFFEGWQNNIDKWLENKNYILCTSILESQNMSVMQAMAKGIKPIVHNFVGAKAIYKSNYLWNSINEAVNIIEDENYNSKEYFQFIEDNYSIKGEINKIKNVFSNLENNKN